MQENHPTRKEHRLKGYNYSTPGAYFVTICTEKRSCILSKIQRRNTADAYTDLSNIGKFVKSAIENIEKIYANVFVDCYSIMPNHVHLLLIIKAHENDFSENKTSIDTIIGQMKRAVSKSAGRSIWQKSFYDHVIRDRNDYEETVKYIYENPIKWFYDELYEIDNP